MAVTLDGGTGLFDRLGKLGHLLNTINGRRGGAAAGDFPVELADALAKYDGATNELRAAVEGLLAQLTALQDGSASMLSAIKAAAAADLIESFDADDPLPERSVTEAILALRKQMLTATTRYVEANAVSGTFTSTGNTGDGICVVAVRDGAGKVLENLLAEDLVIEVSDTSTAGSEQLRVRGELAQEDKLHFDWPAGSGADGTYTAVDAAGSTNLLTNGDFEDFTVANTPDGWTIDTGAAGTEILEEATIVYKGSKALEIVGSATLTAISQAITTAVDSLTNYAVNLWAKVDVVPAAGVLVIDLWDGAAVIQDEEGNNQTFSLDLTTLTTTFGAKNFSFRLKEPLAATVKIRVRLTTALSAGSSLFLDHMGLAEMAQPGSIPGQTPFLAFFSGATNWASDDGHGNGTKVLKVAAANDRASQWQELFDKYFDLADKDLQLPTAGTTILNDNLIA